jgi:hypothetical protein
MTFCICRVIGNYLYPRDIKSDKIKALENVIQKDSEINVPKIWLINRVVDYEYLENIKNILYGQTVFEIAFNQKDYFKCKTYNKKIRYLTNINQARNFLIRNAWAKYEFAISLDGDCFFENANAFVALQKEILLNPNVNYFGLKMIRMIDNKLIHNEEPAIVIKRKSELFDENLVFGNNDKIEFLNRVGIKKEGVWISKSFDSKISEVSVFHTGFDEKCETNLEYRIKMRDLAMKNLVSTIDGCYLN